MFANATTSESDVHELLDVLDSEIELLDERSGQYRQLHQSLIARDEPAMERLLAEMERTQSRQADTDARMQAARRQLAGQLCCRPEELRLGRLASELPPEQGQAIEERRGRIVELTRQVRKEHMRAALLLAECARINRVLRRGLFGGQESCTTYDASGADVWKGAATLLDTER
jgi:flagellar biosynthesis/type III secretory pathway chaperone